MKEEHFDRVKEVISRIEILRKYRNDLNKSGVTAIKASSARLIALTEERNGRGLMMRSDSLSIIQRLVLESVDCEISKLEEELITL